MSDFNKKINDLLADATKFVQDSSHRALTMLDKEKEKARMRSEIGNNKKELTMSYEKLGRACYEALVNGTELNAKEIIEQIAAKEKSIELLSDKLKAVEDDNKATL